MDTSICVERYRMYIVHKFCNKYLGIPRGNLLLIAPSHQRQPLSRTCFYSPREIARTTGLSSYQTHRFCPWVCCRVSLALCQSSKRLSSVLPPWLVMLTTTQIVRMTTRLLARAVVVQALKEPHPYPRHRADVPTRRWESNYSSIQRQS
jgi:hypothetical protein